MKENETNKFVTRRKFLTVGAGTAGLILVGSLAGCSANAPATTDPANTQSDAPSLPWTYKKLDVELVRKRGYESYFEGGCMYGAAKALIATLQETAGGPWKNLPFDAYRYGLGGVYGWGSLCGALNGSLAVINLGVKNHADLGNELMGWYTLFPFPSDKHESYSKFKNQVTTVAMSPLCHVSVTTWAKEAKAKINSDEKKDRCGKLTGDTAARAAELMNLALTGKFTPTFKIPEEYESCMGCHVGTDSKFDSVQGKMDCLSCHDTHY